MTEEANESELVLLQTIEQTTKNDNQTIIYEQLTNDIKKLKSLKEPPDEEVVEVWLKFVPIWSKVLQNQYSDAKAGYDQCSKLLEDLYDLSNFWDISKYENVSRTAFLSLFTQLDQPHIRNYLKAANQMTESSKDGLYFTHVIYLLKFSSLAIGGLSSVTPDILQDISKRTELFKLLIQRIDWSISKSSENIAKKQSMVEEINESTIFLLINITDRTECIPTLLKCDVSKKVIEWLSEYNKLSSQSRRRILGILHNISRHDDGADDLNKYGAIDIIKQCQNANTTKSSKEIIASAMALALLSSPEQLKDDQTNMNDVLNKLFQIIASGVNDTHHVFNGYHVSEPLAIFVKLFVVDEETIDYVFSRAVTKPSMDMHSKIRLLSSLLTSYSNAFQGTDHRRQFTLIALMNIFWSMSFHAQYHSLLKTDKTLLDIINLFAEDDKQNVNEQYKPRSMESVKAAASGILHNLQGEKKEKKKSEEIAHIDPIISNREKSDNKKPMIMISYSHENNTFCTHILNLLSIHSNTFDIWIDRTHCQGTGDLWESIANGMEQSSIIVSILSIQYFESKSCRQEFIYAIDSLKKKVIPILLENFEPRGWLGIRMTGLKYVRFRNLLNPEEKKMEELLNDILLSISGHKPTATETSSSSYQHSTPPPAKNPQPILETKILQLPSPVPRSFDQWRLTGEDIPVWFAHHRISTEMRDLFDFQSGEEMLRYGQILKSDFDRERNIYSKLFTQKYNGMEMPTHEFSRFSLALEQLLEKNQSSSTLNVKHSMKPSKSNICIIL